MEFVRWISSQGSWGIFLACLIGLIYLAFGGLNKNEKRRGWWIAKLRHNSFARLYRELLTALLDRIDRAISPAPDWPDAKGLPKTESGRAWSWRLLDLCLLLAVAYPILGLMLDWAITGDAGRLGNLTVLHAETDHWRRVLPMALLAGLVVNIIMLLRAKSDRKPLRRNITNRGGPVQLLVSLGLAGAFVIAVAFAVAGAITVAFAVAGAMAFAVAVTVSGAFAVAIAVVFAVAGAGAVTSVGAAAFAAAAAGAVARGEAAGRVVVVVRDKFGQWTGRCAAVMLVYVLALLIALGARSHFNAYELANNERSLLLFLGFLPLLNALFDYLSTGLTRWRLRCGIQGHLIRNAVIDALAGYAILLLLAFAIIMTIRLATPPGAPPLLNLDEILTDFREGRANEYYWLIGMLFSTLLPTFVHLCIGCFAAFTILSGRLGRPIAAGLAAGDGPAGNMAALALSLCAALAVWVPCWLLWQLAMLGHEPVLRFTLWVCESFARVIGAI